MNTNHTILPANAVATIVARFNPDFTELHFHTHEATIHICDAQGDVNGVWKVNAVHVSGQEMRITLTPDMSASFGYALSYSVFYDGEWFNNC